MYFSMIRLRRNISPRDVSAITKGDGYHIHKLIWNMFADHPDRRRDFIYRHELVNSWPTFYTISQRVPQDFSGKWEIETKDYHPKLRDGQRLEFTLCANPVRSKRDENGRQHRHDVVMEAKFGQKRPGENTHFQDIVQEHGAQWLVDRSASHGFSLAPDRIRVDGYRQHRLFRGKGKQPITFSTLEFNGILTATDADIFIEKCLFNGIGHAKGFGCGMMMVRRV